MATIGRIEEFCDEKEDWNQYAERLKHFFATNGITEAEKKHSVFLTVIVAKVYKHLRSLISPAKPGETSYKDLTAAMQKHYRPAPSEIHSATFSIKQPFLKAREISVYIHVCHRVTSIGRVL